MYFTSPSNKIILSLCCNRSMFQTSNWQPMFASNSKMTRTQKHNCHHSYIVFNFNAVILSGTVTWNSNFFSPHNFYMSKFFIQLENLDGHQSGIQDHRKQGNIVILSNFNAKMNSFHHSTMWYRQIIIPILELYTRHRGEWNVFQTYAF